MKYDNQTCLQLSIYSASSPSAEAILHLRNTKRQPMKDNNQICLTIRPIFSSSPTKELLMKCQLETFNEG